MISLEVRTPPTVAVGSKPTFELLVANVSAVPCTRTLDKGLQEFLLLDPAAMRFWGSNDCFPEAALMSDPWRPVRSSRSRSVWGGFDQRADVHGSAQHAGTGVRAPALRGRLDTKTSADVPLTLG